LQNCRTWLSQATALDTIASRQLALLKVLAAERMPTDGQPAMKEWQKYKNVLQESTGGQQWTIEHFAPDAAESEREHRPLERNL